MKPLLLPSCCRFESFHFVGIGGIGMSGIAELLSRDGYNVSGSDLQRGSEVRRLEELGIRVEIGHRADNLGEAQAVVYSSAIDDSNPEILEARSRRLPVVHRAEMLGEMMRWRCAIAVSGTHGKTTTTGMVASVLVESELDPVVVVGARIASLGGNARSGSGRTMVVEADESDRSFLMLPAACAVVTNIDEDHMDTYRDLEDLRGAFSSFANQVPFYGSVVACCDDPQTARVVAECRRPVLTYGLSPQADITARSLQLEAHGSSYECCWKGRPLGRIQLRVAGRHNVLNSMAAVAVSTWLQVPFEKTGAALAAYQGAERRMQWKGERKGVRVVDDYAHHPTEIEATLEACSRFGRRLLVVFQPHRYSRTRYLAGKMKSCFSRAQRLYLMDIYPAGEKPIEGVTSQLLADEIEASGPVELIENHSQLLKALQREARTGDILVTLGAGDVWKIGEEFLEMD